MVAYMKPHITGFVSWCQVMSMEEALHTSDGDKKEQAA